MKKSRFYLLPLVLIALAFASCSNISGGGSDGDSSSTTTNLRASTTVTASVTSPVDLVNFSSGSSSGRSIVPTAYDVSDLTFYLAYKAAGDTGFTVNGTVTVTADASDSKKGTFLITLPQASYDLRLYAVPSTITTVYTSESDLNSNASLVAVTSADLRRGDAISFTLRSDVDVLTGTSTALLVLYPSNDWCTPDAYTVTAELQKISDGSLVDGSSATVTLLTSTAAAAITDITETNANYKNGTAVKAGTYNLVVKFTTEANKTYEYSDTVIIMPNKPTTGKVGIPDIVEKAPEAPTGFKAAYTEPSTNEEYYNVEFVWDDNSNNESYFELQLADITSTTATVTLPDGDTAWGTVVNDSANATVTRYGVENSTLAVDDVGSTSANYGSVTTFYGTSNDSWVSGSLQKNNEVIKMKLNLGKRYEARISAVNANGRSDWAYLTIGDDFTDSVTKNHSHTITEAKAFTRTVSKANNGGIGTASNCINLYSLTYALGTNATFSGTGTVVPSSSSDVFKIENNQIVSYYNVGEIAILDPDGDASKDGDSDGNLDDLLLKQGTSYYWTNWKNGTKDYNAYGKAPDAYKGYTNLILTAVYGATASVTIFDYNNYNIGTANISASSENDATVTISSDGTLTVDTSAKTVTWKVTYPTNVTYDKVEISVTPTLEGSTSKDNGTISNGTWEEDISKLTAGKYQVEFRAYHSSNASAYYSCSIYMEVTEK